MNDEIYRKIDLLAHKYYEWHTSSVDEDSLDYWQERVWANAKTLFNDDGHINREGLRNFRRPSVFIPDMYPNSEFGDIDFIAWALAFMKEPIAAIIRMGKEWVSGSGRGSRRDLFDAYDRLVKDNCLDLIKKYPVKDSPGNPYYTTHKGSTFNMRWLRHIYFLNLLQRHLASEIKHKPDFTTLELGCGYGIFTCLLKSEYPRSKHIMVEFPEHLILCYYFLLRAFPDAKFLVVLTPSDVEVFDANTVEDYDFVLIPPDCYQKLQGVKVNLYTNFVSLGEMTREYFHGYLNHPVFQTCDWFFTCNRFESQPRLERTHQTDLTIMDYPLADFEKLFFGVSLPHLYYHKGKHLFFFEKTPFSSQTFDFIGKRQGLVSGLV
jgi:putative sugar O-methyltransferase